MTWQQIYDPFGNMFISTALAAIPVVVMLAALGIFHIKAHIAAGLGLLAALVIAIFAYGMPAEMAGRAALFGGFTGLLPIGWIVLNIIFLHQLTEQNGSFNRPLKKCSSNASRSWISKKRVAQKPRHDDCDCHFGLFAGHVARFGRTDPVFHA